MAALVPRWMRGQPAPPPAITANQRAIVNHYLRRVINNARGNVRGLNIIINQTPKRKITHEDLNMINNREAKKLYNKIGRGGPLINNRFLRQNLFSRAGRAVKRGAVGTGKVAVGLVGEGVKRTGTAVGGAAAGFAGGLYGINLERKLVADLPALVSGDWEKSRIIMYVAETLAEALGVPPAKIHRLLINTALTRKVVANRNKAGQIQWGRNIGAQMVGIYKNMPPNRGKYSNVVNGIKNGAIAAYSPTVARLKRAVAG